MKTLAQRGVKTLPETTTFLSHEPLTSFFKGMFPTGQVTQHVFVRTELIHGGGRDGNVLFQEVQHQFADGIDLIGIGVLEEFFSFEPIGFFEDGLQEGQLTS